MRAVLCEDRASGDVVLKPASSFGVGV